MAFLCFGSHVALGYASSSFARIAATRLGSVPAARAGLAAFADFAAFAVFDFAEAGFFFDGFFFDFLAIGAKTIAWRKEPRAICETPFPGGCADFFLPRASPRKFFRGQGSGTLDRTRIHLNRAAPPGFLHQRGPSRWPWRVRVAPAQSRKRNTLRVRFRSCVATRRATFQSFASSSPAVPRTLRSEPQAHRRAQARPIRNRRRKLARSAAWSSAAPCPRRFRQTSEHFLQTPGAPRNAAAMSIQP